MKIKSYEVGFTDLVYLGIYGYIIDVNLDGFHIDDKNLIEKAILFNNIIIKGEPFEQKKEVGNFIKICTNRNNKIKFYIYTDGFIKPTNISSVDNINFIVIPKLERSNIEFDNRINFKSLDWFLQLGSKFAFIIEDNNEINEISNLVKSLECKNKNVYIIKKDNEIDDIVKLGKIYEYNISFYLKDIFNVKGEEI